MEHENWLLMDQKLLRFRLQEYQKILKELLPKAVIKNRPIARIVVEYGHGDYVSMINLEKVKEARELLARDNLEY